jgi:hypothetical protein
MSDDASLLTNAAALLERYRVEAQELDAEIAQRQERLSVLREVIEVLTGKPRTRRGRAPAPPKLVEAHMFDQFGVASQLTVAGVVSQSEPGDAA